MIEIFIAWMIVWAVWRVSRVKPEPIVIEIIDVERELERELERDIDDFHECLKQPFRRQ